MNERLAVDERSGRERCSRRCSRPSGEKVVLARGGLALLAQVRPASLGSGAALFFFTGSHPRLGAGAVSERYSPDHLSLGG